MSVYYALLGVMGMMIAFLLLGLLIVKQQISRSRGDTSAL